MISPDRALERLMAQVYAERERRIERLVASGISLDDIEIVPVPNTGDRFGGTELRVRGAVVWRQWMAHRPGETVIRLCSQEAP